MQEKKRTNAYTPGTGGHATQAQTTPPGTVRRAYSRLAPDARSSRLLPPPRAVLICVCVTAWPRPIPVLYSPRPAALFATTMHRPYVQRHAHFPAVARSSTTTTLQAHIYCLSCVSPSAASFTYASQRFIYTHIYIHSLSPVSHSHTQAEGQLGPPPPKNSPTPRPRSTRSPPPSTHRGWSPARCCGGRGRIEPRPRALVRPSTFSILPDDDA